MFIYLFMFIFLLVVYIEFVFGMHNTCISAGLKQKKTSSIYSLLYFCRLAKSFIVVFMLSVSSSKNIYNVTKEALLTDFTIRLARASGSQRERKKNLQKKTTKIKYLE